MLATTLHLLRGTPYVFQGEEIGMTNYNFTNIDELRDVESINAYNNLINKNVSKDDALRIVSIHSRDNGRTTMQWDDTKNGGFTDAIPWIMTNNNFTSINVRSQILDKDSILNHYRRLIEYRHKSKLVQYGDIIPMFMDNENIFAYKRVLDNEELLILSNFFNTTKNIQIKYSEYKLELSNYDDIKHDEANIYLRPYESLVLYRRNNP